jgi:DNA-3-methyladenine glycosylase
MANTKSSSVKRLDRTFYQRPAIELAPALIGTILVHRVAGKTLRARIVETEAYIGPHDLAAHSSKGRTARTEVMFGPAGHAYVYFIYGMYTMLNIVAAEVDDAQAVLIRAAEPLDGWDADLSGPGKLARAFIITRADNGLDMTGKKLFLLPSNDDSENQACRRRLRRRMERSVAPFSRCRQRGGFEGAARIE